jgi:hypothetical protein
MTDSYKLARIQRKFAVLCYCRFLIGTCNNGYNILVRLNLSTLQPSLHFLDSVLPTTVFKNKLSCLSIVDTVSLCIPYVSTRDFLTSDVCHCHPSARHVPVVNTVSRYSIFVLTESYFL